MKAECPWCKRNIGCWVPKGGDGSEVRFRNHNPTTERQGPTGGGNGIWCKGSNRLDSEHEPVTTPEIQDSGDEPSIYAKALEILHPGLPKAVPLTEEQLEALLENYTPFIPFSGMGSSCCGGVFG